MYCLSCLQTLVNSLGPVMDQLSPGPKAPSRRLVIGRFGYLRERVSRFVGLVC